MNSILESIFKKPYLFKRVVQALFFATFSSLILIRILARFGMHIPAEVRKAPFVIFFFRSIFFLGSAISYVSMGLVLIALTYVLYHKMSSNRRSDLVISFLLLFLIVIAILSYIIETNIAASFINDIASLALILILSFTSLNILKKGSEKAMMILLGLAYLCFFYFKISQGLYMVTGRMSPPPLISWMIGMAEGFVVLSIFSLFLAYSEILSNGLGAIFSKDNIKILILPSVVSIIFLVIDLIDPYALAVIFTWALGLTLYLPPVIYIIALWLFTYTIMHSLFHGKSIAYAAGLIYFSGFAVSLSLELLTLILGFSLINIGEIGEI